MDTGHFFFPSSYIIACMLVPWQSHFIDSPNLMLNCKPALLLLRLHEYCELENFLILLKNPLGYKINVSPQFYTYILCESLQELTLKLLWLVHVKILLMFSDNHSNHNSCKVLPCLSGLTTPWLGGYIASMYYTWNSEFPLHWLFFSGCINQNTW